MNKTCTKCQNGCNKCEGKTFQCTGCVDGFFLVNGFCADLEKLSPIKFWAKSANNVSIQFDKPCYPFLLSQENITLGKKNGFPIELWIQENSNSDPVLLSYNLEIPNDSTMNFSFIYGKKLTLSSKIYIKITDVLESGYKLNSSESFIIVSSPLFQLVECPDGSVFLSGEIILFEKIILF